MPSRGPDPLHRAKTDTFIFFSLFFFVIIIFFALLIFFFDRLKLMNFLVVQWLRVYVSRI